MTSSDDRRRRAFASRSPAVTCSAPGRRCSRPSIRQRCGYRGAWPRRRSIVLGSAGRALHGTERACRECGAQVSQVAGIGLVETCGERPAELRVDVDSARLAAFGLTVADALGAVRSPITADLGNSVVGQRDSAPVHLRDVASISEGRAASPASCLFIGASPDTVASRLMRRTAASVGPARAQPAKLGLVAVPGARELHVEVGADSPRTRWAWPCDCSRECRQGLYAVENPRRRHARVHGRRGPSAVLRRVPIDRRRRQPTATVHVMGTDPDRVAGAAQHIDGGCATRTCSSPRTVSRPAARGRSLSIAPRPRDSTSTSTRSTRRSCATRGIVAGRGLTIRDTSRDPSREHVRRPDGPWHRRRARPARLGGPHSDERIEPLEVLIAGSSRTSTSRSMATDRRDRRCTGGRARRGRRRLSTSGGPSRTARRCPTSRSGRGRSATPRRTACRGRPTGSRGPCSGLRVRLDHLERAERARVVAARAVAAALRVEMAGVSRRRPTRAHDPVRGGVHLEAAVGGGELGVVEDFGNSDPGLSSCVGFHGCSLVCLRLMQRGCQAGSFARARTCVPRCFNLRGSCRRFVGRASPETAKPAAGCDHGFRLLPHSGPRGA